MKSDVLFPIDESRAGGQSFKFHSLRRTELDSRRDAVSPQKMKFERLTRVIPASRRGMVLLIVTVVVAHARLGRVELRGQPADGTQGGLAAGPGVCNSRTWSIGAAAVQAFCRQSWAVQQQAGGTWDNAGLFRNVVVLADESTKRQAQFSVLAASADEGDGGQVRFGLQSESAKRTWLPCCAGSSGNRAPGSALLALPGMTVMLADAILDWLDADATARPFGPRPNYYQGRGLPYEPRNGVPQCLEELLLIREVTRPLVFGAELDRSVGRGSVGDEAAYAGLPGKRRVEPVLGVAADRLPAPSATKRLTASGGSRSMARTWGNCTGD